VPDCRDASKNWLRNYLTAASASRLGMSTVKKCPPNWVNFKSGAPVGNAAPMSESGHNGPSLPVRHGPRIDAHRPGFSALANPLTECTDVAVREYNKQQAKVRRAGLGERTRTAGSYVNEIALM